MKKLISEKITITGFFMAMIDVMAMAMFLLGTLYCANETKYYGDLKSLACIAMMILMFSYFIQYLMRLVQPLHYYHTIQVFTEEPLPANPGRTTWDCGYINLEGRCLCDDSDSYNEKCPYTHLIECPVHNEKLCQH